MRRPIFLAALLGVTAALVLPAAAGASTSVALSGGGLTVIGDAFRNDIEVVRVGDGYLVRDPLARLTIDTGSQCFFTSSATPPHEAKCLRSSEIPVRIEGRAADDELKVVGGARGAVLDGENGQDRLEGGPADDSLRGGPDGDDLLGSGGDDVMNGEGGPDDFQGGPGTDAVSYSDRAVGVNITLPVDVSNVAHDDGNVSDGLAGQRDFIATDVENAVGGDGNDSIVGNNAANNLDGRGGNDTLFGRSGDDLLGGGLAADVLGGNEGFDLAFYGERTVPVTVTLDGAANDGAGAPDQTIGSGLFAGQGSFDNVGPDVEGVVGGAAADTLIGDGGPNRLDGRGGNDTIDGRAGDDDIDGGDGDDTLEGFIGGDDVSGGAGRDSVNYAVRGLLSDVRVTVSLDGVADDGSAAVDGFADNIRPDIENVTGASGDDVLVGGAAANLLDGGDGDDRLEGRGGNDTLRGEAGSDLMDGGDGTDTATYQPSGLGGGVGQGPGPVTVTLDGVANDGIPEGTPGVLLPQGGERDNVLTENVTGGEDDDTIIGDEGPNALSGRGGDDTVRGAGGNDAVDGGAGLDTLLGEAGPDILLANDGLADEVDCGPDVDLAFADLADAGPLQRAGANPLPDSAGCENQSLAPAGRLPNVALADRLVRVDGQGRAHLALRCPRRSQRRCAGTVRLERLDATALGRARFSIARGRQATITIRLRRPALRGAAQIIARERDLTGRPKLTLARVRLQQTAARAGH